MPDDNNLLLVLNAGSSSLRADVYDATQLSCVLSVKISGIGQGSTTISCDGVETELRDLHSTDFDSALEELFTLLSQKLSTQPSMVGYRVVHGGDKFQTTTVIDDDFVEELSRLTSVDLEHTPITQKVIKYCRRKYSAAKHVACFDTTFFVDLPMVAKQMSLPHQYYQQGIHRYGFHGLSYTYLLEEFGRNYPKLSSGRIIMAHLGSGVSLTAVIDGKPFDTTMAYSPTSGVMMSTRSGDIDPAVYWRLISGGMSNDDVMELLSKKSGLLGVSGLSADMYTLLEHESQDENARLAIEMFCYQVKKVIGSFYAAMGGCDAIIFSGGMGENAPKIRARILEDLDFMGVELDSMRNQQSEQCITSDASQVGTYVIHTDESKVIAHELMGTV